MIYEFNADNILQLAVDIEKNGAVFYREAARRTDDNTVKQVLSKLANEEDEHGRIFSDMRGNLSEQQKGRPGFDLGGDVAGYLKALADTRIFFEKEILLPEAPAGITSVALLKNIYITAIRAEKESIVFYVGLREMVPESFGRSKVDGIIQEEMLHLTRLSKELAAI